MIDLRKTIFALAAPAEVQEKLYPDFVCIGDELVLDFDNAFQCHINNSGFSEEQKGALMALDMFLEQHSGEEFEDMYCNEKSLFTDNRWQTIRDLSASVIECMGWKYQNPAKNNAVYASKHGVHRNT